jgi:hypothetical protein
LVAAVAEVLMVQVLLEVWEQFQMVVMVMAVVAAEEVQVGMVTQAQLVGLAALVWWVQFRVLALTMDLVAEAEAVLRRLLVGLRPEQERLVQTEETLSQTVAVAVVVVGTAVEEMEAPELSSSVTWPALPTARAAQLQQVADTPSTHSLALARLRWTHDPWSRFMGLLVLMTLRKYLTLAIFVFCANARAGGNIPFMFIPNQSTVSTCAAGSQVFTFTGASQSLSIPAGCTSITVKAWGAGGGSGQNGLGGGGGFTSGVLTFASGAAITVWVGGGGTGGSEGGGGGGLSGVKVNGTYMIIAAGGGGGRWDGANTNGGAGGGLIGSDAMNTARGLGGTQSAGGAAGAGGLGNQTAGSLYQGGNGQGGGAVRAGGWNGGGSGQQNNWGAGGGGGGYYGGGGGGFEGAGGGGSALVPAGGTTTAGSGQTPGNTGDAAYTGSAGLGGSLGGNGANGLIVISWWSVNLSKLLWVYFISCLAFI